MWGVVTGIEDAVSYTALNSSPAGWLPHGFASSTGFVINTKPVGASLLAMRPSATPHQLHRQQRNAARAAPTKVMVTADLVIDLKPLWELAC